MNLVIAVAFLSDSRLVALVSNNQNVKHQDAVTA
jgi:hypothetical protein